MSDIHFDAKDQIKRVNARIAEIAADYARSQMKRDLSLQIGAFRRASELTERLRFLNSQLAYLASQKRLYSCSHRCRKH
jgi:hypothetical protein